MSSPFTPFKNCPSKQSCRKTSIPAMPDYRPPLILDIDASVLPLCPSELRLPFRAWQEQIRYSCSSKTLKQFAALLRTLLPKRPGCVFLGSGDFHHISYLLVAQLEKQFSAKNPIDLIVCDNHPDNMRFLTGIHCGSWVSHASALPHIRHVHILGLHSKDITWPHAWENRLRPFLRKKLSYWSVGENASWLSCIGRRSLQHSFPNPKELLDAFLPKLEQCESLYLSIDKDVLSPQFVQTNWDQGLLSPRHLERIIRACIGKLKGADICGDFSAYTHKRWLKKILRRADGPNFRSEQPPLGGQIQHQIINKELLDLICQAADWTITPNEKGAGNRRAFF